MNKLQLARVLAKVRNLPEHHYYAFTVEDVAVLQSFLESFPLTAHASERQRALHQKICRILSYWKNASQGAEDTDPLTMRERVQQTLRQAVQKLEDERYDELAPGEAHFVRGAWHVLQECARPPRNLKRLRSLLSDLLERYDHHLLSRESGNAEEMAMYVPLPLAVLEECAAEILAIAPQADEEASLQTCTFEVDSLFKGVRRCHIARLQGIEVDLTVQQIEKHGTTHVIGTLPEDTLLVVRDGSVHIDGYCLGNVVATGDITITGNVSGGWLISSEGDIAIHNVLAKAKVIAKAGAVHCQNAELADRIFAWRDLTVAGRVLGGKLMAQRIEIAESAASAEIHAVGDISIARLGVSQWGDTVVCLRETILCGEYGRALESRAKSLSWSARRLRAEVDLAVQVMSGLRRDIDNCYRTMLYYVHGGATNAEAIRALRAIQAKTSYFELLFDTGKRLEELAMAYVEGVDSTARLEASQVAEACLAMIADIKGRVPDLPPIPPQYKLNYRESLIHGCDQLAVAAELLRSGGAPRQALEQVARKVAGCLRDWTWHLDQLAKCATAVATDYGIDPGLGFIIERRPDQLAILWQNAQAKANNAPGIEHARRLTSPFVAVMEKTIAQNRKQLLRWDEALIKTRNRLDEVNAQLEKEAAVLHPEGDAGPATLRAGEIAAGVIVTSSPQRVDGVPAPPAVSVRFAEALVHPPVFILKDHKIHALDEASDGSER
jgi:flagellar biosynthesis chaperone FliJ